MASAEEKLRIFLQDVARKENYLLSNIEIKPISSEGANYTTDLYLARITQPLKEDINIFAKVANLNESVRTKIDVLTRVYVIEGLFYSELAVNFERLYNKHNIPAADRLVLPKYYGHVLTPYEETMVLENLEERGFKNFDRMKSFNWEYASTAVTQLAKFHALGFAFRDESPAEFEKIVSNFENNFQNNEAMMLMVAFMEKAIENACEVLSDDYKLRLQKYFAAKENITFVMTQMTEDKTCLVHGDLKPSNLMQRRRNGNLELILLDYQTLREGNPVTDLMYFIFSGSDEEFRRLHYQRIVDHYFSQLTKDLARLNVDVENVYPRKTFEKDLVELLPFGLAFGLMMAGMVTVAPEDAPKIDGDLSDFQVKPNEVGAARIRGIVNDFVRWGVI